MNWDRVSGNWKQFRGKVKEQWGKLTDDELDQINGNREQLEGKIQERYGIAKDVAKKQIDDALNRWRRGRPTRRRYFPRLIAGLRVWGPVATRVISCAAGSLRRRQSTT